MTLDFVFIWIVILTGWLTLLSWFCWRAISHYRRLIQATGSKTLDKILDKLLRELVSEQKEIDNLKKIINQIQKNQQEAFSQVGLVRFNPFLEVGGEQSFCLALLNKKGKGIVITGFHGRQTSRVYVKLIEPGKEVKLTGEEKEAIRLATKEKK